MKKMGLFSIFVAGAIFALTGCATLLAGNKNKALEITSSPVGTDYIVYDENHNQIADGVTPATLHISKSGTYTIEVSKAGHIPETRTIELKVGLNASFLLDFVLAGVGGIASLLAIEESATGAAFTLGGSVALVGVVGILVDLSRGAHFHIIGKESFYLVSVYKAAAITAAVITLML